MNTKSQHIPIAFFMKSVKVLMYGAEKTINSITDMPAKLVFVTRFMRKYAGTVDSAENNETPTFTPKLISPTITEVKDSK